MPPFVWTEGFQRQVLWCATRGDLLRRVPGAFAAKMFAPESGEAGPPSPRERLARLVEGFVSASSLTESLGVDTMDGLVEGQARTLSPAERDLLQQEWRAIRNTPPPPDPGFIESQVGYWARRAAVIQALMRAATLLSTPVGGPELDQAQALLAGAWEVGHVGQGDLPVPVLATADARVKEWENPQDLTWPIPTGLAPLDSALRGGVRPGEVFYFLAPPKGAKTSFLTAITRGASRARCASLFCSFEMMLRPMLSRYDRGLARASREDLIQDPARLSRAVRGYGAAGAGEIWVWTGLPQQKDALFDVRRHIDALRQQGHPIDLVCLDYLNILGASRSLKEREKRHELASISREIAALAKSMGVAVWSAALVNRQAVNREVIRKTDIAEAFEVIAVADGIIAICAPPRLRQNRLRRLFAAALREDEDERWVGTYLFEAERMSFSLAPDPPPPGDEGGLSG